MSSHVFSDIYRENRWGGKESLSGPGSGKAATAPIARWLPALVAELGIANVLDVACGDGYWMPELPGYHGIDVAPEAIARARGLHPQRSFEVMDGRYLPRVAYDLVMVRDALQHLPLRDGLRVLNAIRRTGSQWLLASTYTAPSARHGRTQAGLNVDIAPGEAYSPDLTGEPFLMGQPMRLVPDGWDYRTGRTIRDPAKYLGLWKLRDG